MESENNMRLGFSCLRFTKIRFDYMPDSTISSEASRTTNDIVDNAESEHCSETLRIALELAKEAVQSDSQKNDPERTIKLYEESVALLAEVLVLIRSEKELIRLRSVVSGFSKVS